MLVPISSVDTIVKNLCCLVVRILIVSVLTSHFEILRFFFFFDFWRYRDEECPSAGGGLWWFHFFPQTRTARFFCHFRWGDFLMQDGSTSCLYRHFNPNLNKKVYLPIIFYIINRCRAAAQLRLTALLSNTPFVKIVETERGVSTVVGESPCIIWSYYYTVYALPVTLTTSHVQCFTGSAAAPVGGSA